MHDRETRTHHSNNQIPHGTRELENRNGSYTPQNNRHIDCCPLVLRLFLIIAAELIQARGTQDNGSESEVAKHPRQHDGTSESLVIVGLPLGFRCHFLLLGWLVREFHQFGLVLRVQVAVVLWDVDIDLAAGFQVSRRQFLGLVIALGTPCDIMGVTERVDVQNVDVRGGEQDVLDKLFMVSVYTVNQGERKLTQVNMCQGSKKIKDAINHITYVAPRETMIVKNC